MNGLAGSWKKKDFPVLVAAKLTRPLHNAVQYFCSVVHQSHLSEWTTTWSSTWWSTISARKKVKYLRRVEGGQKGQFKLFLFAVFILFPSG
jgi:hypothetical protein